MLLIEQNDEWLVGRRYLSEASMALVLAHEAQAQAQPQPAGDRDHDAATQANALNRKEVPQLTTV